MNHLCVNLILESSLCHFVFLNHLVKNLVLSWNNNVTTWNTVLFRTLLSVFWQGHYALRHAHSRIVWPVRVLDRKCGRQAQDTPVEIKVRRKPHCDAKTRAVSRSGHWGGASARRKESVGMCCSNAQYACRMSKQILRALGGGSKPCAVTPE